MRAGGGIRVSGLVKRYGERPVLRGFSLRVEAGEFVAIVGPSGSGKTTLFRCLARLTEPDAGETIVAGHPMHALQGRRLALARRDVGIVFQGFNLIRRRSALDNVLTGRLAAMPLWRVALRAFAEDDRRAASSALERVGLLEHIRQRADELSGGQQQRVAIARALAQEARVLLADEPISSLDPDNAAGVLSLMRDIARKERLAVLCSLHQPELAARYCDRVIRIDGAARDADAA